MDALDALERALDHTHAVIGRVRPERYPDPTPCARWTVGDLLAHVVGVVTALDAALMAGRSGTDVESVALDADPAAAFAARARSALAAWRRPGAMEVHVDLGPGPQPSELMARFLVMELLVHSWDLATATGQDATLPDELVAVASEVASRMVPAERNGPQFAPRITLDAGATPVDRLLAYLGRDPRHAVSAMP